MKEILITSTVLIAVILLLRLILGKRVSKRLIYATWLLVALRLLVPFQFGELPFSITAVSEQFEQQSPVIQQVQEDFQQPLVGPDQNAIYDQLMQDYLFQNDAVTLPPTVETQLRQEATAATAITPVALFTMIWIGGMVLIAGWFIITNLLFLGKAQRNSMVFNECISPIPVRISPNVSTPCLAGLFRPRIYLTPEVASNPQQLDHVLTHELTHLKHLDHIWAWVRCLCLCIYWFDPLVWVAAIVSKRDCELACDEAALKQLGESQRIAYGRTLLATVTHTPVRVFQTTTAMSESGKQLKERVNFIVRKPRTLLIAAVCLVLVASLTVTLVFTGCGSPNVNLPNPPVAEEQTTVPTTESTTVQPPTPQTPADVISHDVLNVTPPLLTEEPAEALLIAQDAISRYLLYRVTGICCDYEYIYADLSQYLAEEQKDEYYTQQYKITCCRNAQEVKNHIDRCIGSDLRNGYPVSRLFTDSDENLYLTITPTGYDGYRHFDVISQTEDRIIARACSYDEDGCFRATIFTLSKMQAGYQVTQVKEDTSYRCEPVVVDEGSNYKVLRYGSYYDYEIYGDDGYLRVRQTTQFYCPTVTRISEDVWEIAVNYGYGKIQRTYWEMSRMRSEVYENVVAVGFGKIAYLEGDLENRVLVVCDIFDRTNATTHKEMGFAPEAMPVTQAIFTEDSNGYGYVLTISYRMGKQTNTTKTLYISP